MERQNAEQWDGVKLNELAQAYMEVRREMWGLLASRVGEKWTLVEQKASLYNLCSTQIQDCAAINHHHSVWKKVSRI
jgi:hypothetical protein